MSKQSKMTGADYLLLLLYLDNCSAINGAIRITKMMFLFNMEIAPVLKKKGVSIRDEDLPKFSAYNYGPFSKDVYEQVELFQSIGFIKVKNLYATEEMSEVDDWEESAFETEFSEGSCQYSSNQDGKFMQYKLLNLGKKYVEREIIPQLTNDQLAVLTTYKQRIFFRHIAECGLMMLLVFCQSTVILAQAKAKKNMHLTITGIFAIVVFVMKL